MFDIENSIGFLLAKVHQLGFALFKEQLDRYSLTPPQFSVLAFLWQEDGLSQADLSTKTHIDRTTIGGLIDRLEKDGLVTRLPHPVDRRAYRICLTGRGQSLEKELCELACSVQERFIARISHEERATLLQLLQKLRS